MINTTIPEAGVLAALGYGVVFMGLIALMVVILLIGKVFTAKKKTAAPAEAAAPTNVEVTPVAEAPVVSGPVAPGSAGQLKLYDTPPKTAAMLMAIVAHQMGKPLNELRFISIKEVK